MNEEDRVTSKPLEATTEVISKYLKSKVKVNNDENIINPTKENNNLSEVRRKNTTVSSISRNSIETEEINIVNDSDSIKKSEDKLKISCYIEAIGSYNRNDFRTSKIKNRR